MRRAHGVAALASADGAAASALLRRAASRGGRRFCSAHAPSLVGVVRGGDAAAPPVTIRPSAVTEAEESRLLRECDKWLAKKPYEGGHFDRVIAGYRELQKPLRGFSPASRAVLERLSASAFDGASKVLPVHLLDLEPAGVISRHVDHVEYSGGLIVGLSLLSDAVMTLHHEASGASLPLYLPRRSLYVLRGAARYEWAHSLHTEREWEGKPLPPPSRRLALIFRDAAAPGPG